MGRYVNSTQQILDSNGDPIVGGKTYFYSPGTTTLKTVYSDSALSIPIANPVISLSGGYLPDIFLSGVYKVEQKDENDVTIFTDDPVGLIDTSQFSDWNNDEFYSFNDIVKGSDLAFYKSLVAGTNTNQGNDPVSSPTEWGDATFATIDGTETLTSKTVEDGIYTDTINSTSIDSIYDEDDMASNDANGLASQQSIKAYVDNITQPIYDSGVIATAVTTIDIPSLDLSPTESYNIVFTFINSTASNFSYYLTANGLHTVTNYYSQRFSANGATLLGARSNTPEIASCDNNNVVVGNGIISLDNNKGYSVNTQSTKHIGSNVQFFNYAVSKTAALSGNLTSLRITAVIALGIGIGSRFRIYRTL